jgi:hypothetical protein
MRYLKRSGLIISAIMVFLGSIAILPSTAEAQRRVIRRPVIVRHVYRDPFWRGTLWDPYWGRGYYYDPYYREMREEYYERKAVSDAQKKLAKDREKFYADGYLDSKEAKKLRERQEKYSKAVAELNDDD